MQTTSQRHAAKTRFDAIVLGIELTLISIIHRRQGWILEHATRERRHA